MTQITFDSAALYISLIQAQAQMTETVKERTGEQDFKVHLNIFLWNEPDFQLSIASKYGSSMVEVKGKHLEQMMEEGLRRLGFANQQERLQLTHEVEGELVTEAAPQPVPADDEIPF